MNLSRRQFVKTGLLYIPMAGIVRAQDVLPTRRKTGGPPLPAAVSDWVNRVQINGGAKPSNGTITAVTTWYNALVAANIHTQIIAGNFMAPDSQIAQNTPFFVGGGNDPWTGMGNFSVNGFSTSAGGSCNTNLNPASIFSTSDMGYSCYVRTATVKPRISWGGGNGSSAFAQIWNSGTSYDVGSYAAWTISGATSGIATDAYGFYSANRTGTTSTALYNANGSVAWVSIGSSAAASGTPPTGTGANAIGWNSSGSVTITDVCLLSYLTVHHGFSTSQGQAEFNAAQALRTAFGGGFT